MNFANSEISDFTFESYQFASIASANLMHKWGITADLFDLSFFDFTLTSRSIVLFGLVFMGYNQRQNMQVLASSSSKRVSDSLASVSSVVKDVTPTMSTISFVSQTTVDRLKADHAREVAALRAEIVALQARHRAPSIATQY